jgi:hypothetical protein
MRNWLDKSGGRIGLLKNIGMAPEGRRFLVEEGPSTIPVRTGTETITGGWGIEWRRDIDRGTKGMCVCILASRCICEADPDIISKLEKGLQAEGGMGEWVRDGFERVEKEDK